MENDKMSGCNDVSVVCNIYHDYVTHTIQYFSMSSLMVISGTYNALVSKDVFRILSNIYDGNSLRK